MSEATLRAGAAEIVIPSQPGLDLAGFVARENPSRGKRDEIFARTLALESNGTLVLLLMADVLGFEASTVRRVRDAIARAVSSAEPAAARHLSITICATHTHSAPASMPLRNCGEMDPAFVDGAVRTLSEAAISAVRDLQPARLGTGSGILRRVSGNRRTAQWMQRGASVPGVGESSSEPIDPEVGVLRVDAAADGRPIACLVNFACHPVILGHDNLEISADYPGVVAQRLKERLGGGAVTLFTNGATGDINPMRRGYWADVEWVAGAIIDETARVWRETKTGSAVSLSARSEEVTLPFLPLPSRGELEEMARRFRAQQEQATRGTDQRVADAYRRWAEDALQSCEEEESLRQTVEIQAVHIGDAALIAVPGEFFVELGLRIKERLAAEGIRPTWILGFTNGNIGYIPTRAAYPQGGYEVETAHRFYGHPACVAPEAGEAIVERAVALARSATPAVNV